MNNFRRSKATPHRRRTGGGRRRKSETDLRGSSCGMGGGLGTDVEMDTSQMRRLLEDFVSEDEEPADAGRPMTMFRLWSNGCGRVRVASRRHQRSRRHLLVHFAARRQNGPAHPLPGDHSCAAHRERRPHCQRLACQQQPASRHKHRAAVSGARPADGRPDAGGRDRPDPRGGKVQLAARLPVQHVCHALDTADHHARHRQFGPQHPPARVCRRHDWTPDPHSGRTGEHVGPRARRGANSRRRRECRKTN